MRKKINLKKIDTRITLDQYRRLNSIAKAYRFRSYYDLLQYLVHCFLKATDPTYSEEPLPAEIKKMFNIDSIKKLLGRIPRQGELFKEKPKSEIEQTFDNLSDAQAPKYGEGMKFRKSNSQIKYEKEDEI